MFSATPATVSTDFWRPWYGQLRLAGTQLCLDVPNRDDETGLNVQLYACNSTPAQIWTFLLSEATLRVYESVGIRAPGDDPLGDDGLEARVRDRVGVLLDRFARGIDAAIAAGEARPVDADRLTRYLWGAWNGVISLQLQPDGLRLSDDEITATLELARWLLREGLATAPLRDQNGEVGDRVPLPYIERPR